MVPLPWTDLDTSQSSIGWAQEWRGSPITEFSLLLACQKTRIYDLIHFTQNLFLKIYYDQVRKRVM